jgi:hypothetical protein
VQGRSRIKILKHLPAKSKKAVSLTPLTNQWVPFQHSSSQVLAGSGAKETAKLEKRYGGLRKACVNRSASDFHVTANNGSISL